MNKPKLVQHGLLLFLMRVTLIQIIITSFTVMMAHAIDSSAQEVLERRITINVESAAFPEVLSMISQQAKVKFTYSPRLVETDKKITLHFSDAPLGDVLNKLLQPDVAFKVIGKQIVLKPANALSSSLGDGSDPTWEAPLIVKITGRVTDMSGSGLPGVNVLIKGSNNGTSTDADGNYSIEVANPDAVLVFSFIGYSTQEIPIGNQTTINVTLDEDIQSLSEVVVVGYGTQEKKEVTGAISQISNKDIMTSSAVSVSNALAGKVPGLIVNQTGAEPGRDNARVLVRGIGTTGNTDVLYVVDGVANRDAISRIDPNDIETITVLKDASAAIYGAQAANGVILITTKRGKTGKPVINYSFNQGFVSPTRKVKLASGELYAKSVNAWRAQSNQTPLYTDAQIQQLADGTTPTTDWIDAVYKPYSLQNRHNIKLSGGNDVVKYFLSAGTVYQNGLVRHDETTHYKQYNFRSNVDVQITERLKVGFNLAGRREDSRWLQYEDNTIYSNTIRASPLIAATIDGLPTAGRQNQNPLAIAQGPGYLSLQRDVFNGTITGEYKIPGVEGLSVDGFAAIDIFDGFRKHFFQQYTYYQDAGGVPEAVKGGPSIDQTYLRLDFQKQQSVTLNGKIKYERTFGAHSITGFLAYEQNEVKADTTFVQRMEYTSDKIDQLYAGSADAQKQSNDGSAWEFSRQNYFGRLAYSYNDRYMLQVHFRSDGSSRFPANKRWGFFPGVSAGWRLSEESFLAGNNFVNNLKLRASWGKLGNDRVDAFQYLNLMNYGDVRQGYVINGNNVNLLNPAVAANPNITWETKRTLDIGLDAGVLNNRLTVEFDIFFEKRSNILAYRNVTVPDYTGLILPQENIAKVQNRGIETQITYSNSLMGGELTYNVGGNFTYAHNKILFNDEGNVYPEKYQKAEGHSVGSQLAYDYIGVYRTAEDIANHPGLDGVADFGYPMYRDVNGDGSVTNADQIRIDRNDIPQIQYGLNLGAQYKGFDLSVTFQGQARVYQYLRYSFSDGNNGLEYFLKNAYEKDTNPNGSLPEINRGNTTSQLSTLWLRDVSFLRLKNTELGYTLPKDLTSKIGIQTVRVYFNGYNLLTFDKLKKDGLTDPEGVDIEGWQFPHTKSVNFGINVTL